MGVKFLVRFVDENVETSSRLCTYRVRIHIHRLIYAVSSRRTRKKNKRNLCKGATYRKIPSNLPFHNKRPPLNFVTLGEYTKVISSHIVDPRSAHPSVSHDYFQILSGRLLGILRYSIPYFPDYTRLKVEFLLYADKSADHTRICFFWGIHRDKM
uniref:Uncharacterized protein n=1 Tax=Ixodes ricinus TaxID=34613 RepID=A0A6B0UVS6_IXORI